MKKHWRIFFLVGIVAALAVYVTFDRQRLSVATAATSATHTPPPAIPAKTSASATAPTAPVTQATVTPMKIPQSQAKAYSTARDLSAYIDSLQTDGSSEDEILTAKARAMEECLMFKIRPNYAEEAIESRARITQENSALFRNYIDTLSQRCSTLIHNEQVSRENLAAYYAKAASEGNAEAMVHELGREIFSSEITSSAPVPSSSELRQKMLDILNSGDPTAIFFAGDLFNENSIFTGKATGSPIAVAAWQLAACDLGLDCTENGILLRGYCVNGGVLCGPGDLRWHFREVEFSPAAYQKIIDLEAEIYAAIRSGNAASLF